MTSQEVVLTRSNVSHMTGIGPDQCLKYFMRMRNRKLRNIHPIGSFSPEVVSSNVTRSDRRSRDPKGLKMCACTTGSSSISDLLTRNGVTQRTSPGSWRCYLGRPHPISSMAAGTNPGYLLLLFLFNIFQ